MAALPYMQLFVADYLADTMHLEADEHGAYMLLMMNYWQTGKPIPKHRLQKTSRVHDKKRWAEVEQSLSEYFTDTGDHWQHNRIEADLSMVQDSQEQRVKAGKASAASKREAKLEKLKNDSKAKAASVKQAKNEKATTVQRKTNDRSTTVQRESNDRSTERQRSSNEKSTNKDREVKGEGKPDKPLSVKPDKPVITVQPVEKSKEPKSAAIWDFYSAAYERRYGVMPVRNGKVNKQLCLVVDRLGADAAPYVAEFYANHSSSWYMQKMHSVDGLLADCEKLHTEWQTQTQMTAAKAREADRTQANFDSIQEAKQIRANREARRAQS